MTKRKLSAASMLAKISRCHSAVRGMSFQSTHASRFCTARASPSLRTKSLSLREYDMKTCAIPTKPHRFRRWVYLSLTKTRCSRWRVLSCKVDHAVIEPDYRLDDVNQIHRSIVHRRGPPASNGVGNQTNGRRHQNCGPQAKCFHP